MNALNMMKTTKTIATFLALSALAFSAVACGGPHYQTHEIDKVVAPTGGTMSLTKIRIPLGGAVKAHLVAYDDNHHYMTGGVTSDAPNIIAPENEITGDDDWVFLGVTPGTTVVHLQANGVVVHDIDAEVVDVQDTSQPF
jgi:hypothetical protein